MLFSQRCTKELKDILFQHPGACNTQNPWDSGLASWCYPHYVYDCYHAQTENVLHHLRVDSDQDSSSANTIPQRKELKPTCTAQQLETPTTPNSQASASCTRICFKTSTVNSPKRLGSKVVAPQTEWFQLPPVWTWAVLAPASGRGKDDHDEVDKNSRPCFRDDKASIDPWTDSQMSSYVQQLLSEYMDCPSPLDGYDRFEAGVSYAMVRCPESHRPWLHKLSFDIRTNSLLKSRGSQIPVPEDDGVRASSLRRPSSPMTATPPYAVLDQVWEDESKGRWWHDGRIICYFCGDSGCEDNADFACERRKREVLCLDRASHKRRSKGSRKKM